MSVRSTVENLTTWTMEAGAGDTERLILRIEEAVAKLVSETEDIVNVEPCEENFPGLKKIVASRFPYIRHAILQQFRVNNLFLTNKLYNE